MTSEAIYNGLDPNGTLKSLFKDKDWNLKSSIGGVFNVLALLLVFLNPLLFPVSVCLMALVQGYCLRTMRVIIKEGKTGLPPWGDWFDLFVSGMSWLAILTLFIFALFSVFCLSLITGSLFHASRTFEPSFVFWAAGTIIGIKLLAFWFLFFTSCLMANFAEEESMPAGFAYAKTFRRIIAAPKDFVCAWLIGAGLIIAFIVLPVLTIVGAFLLPTTIFIAQLLAASLIAQVWRSTASDKEEDKSSADKSRDKSSNADNSSDASNKSNEDKSSKTDKEPKSGSEKSENP